MNVSLTVLSGVASTDLRHLRSTRDEEEVTLALALRVRLGELEGVQLKSDLKIAKFSHTYFDLHSLLNAVIKR